MTGVRLHDPRPSPIAADLGPDLDLVDPRVAHELALRLADDAPQLFGAVIAVLHRRQPTRLGGSRTSRRLSSFAGSSAGPAPSARRSRRSSPAPTAAPRRRP